MIAREGRGGGGGVVQIIWRGIVNYVEQEK